MPDPSGSHTAAIAIGTGDVICVSQISTARWNAACYSALNPEYVTVIVAVCARGWPSDDGGGR